MNQKEAIQVDEIIETKTKMWLIYSRIEKVNGFSTNSNWNKFTTQNREEYKARLALCPAPKIGNLGINYQANFQKFPKLSKILIIPKSRFPRIPKLSI